MDWVVYGISLIVLLACAFYTATGWSTGKKHSHGYWLLVMAVIAVILFYIIRMQLAIK